MLYKKIIRLHHSDEHAGSINQHEHHHKEPVSAEKAEALMKYMIDHNAHHAEEIRELEQSVDSEAAKLMEQAVNSMENSVAFLQDALAIIQNETGEK